MTEHIGRPSWAAIAVLVLATVSAGSASAQTYTKPMVQNPGDNRYTLLFPTFERKTLVRITFVGLTHPGDAAYLRAKILAQKGGPDKPRSGYFRDGERVWIERDSGKDEGNYVGNLTFGGRKPAAFFRRNPGAYVRMEVIDP